MVCALHALEGGRHSVLCHDMLLPNPNPTWVHEQDKDPLWMKLRHKFFADALNDVASGVAALNKTAAARGESNKGTIELQNMKQLTQALPEYTYARTACLPASCVAGGRSPEPVGMCGVMDCSACTASWSAQRLVGDMQYRLQGQAAMFASLLLRCDSRCSCACWLSMFESTNEPIAEPRLD